MNYSFLQSKTSEDLNKEAETIQKFNGVRKTAVTRETRKVQEYIDNYKVTKADDPDPSIVSYIIAKDAFKCLAVAKVKLVYLEKCFDVHSNCISMAYDETDLVQRTYTAAKVKDNEDKLI